MQNHEPAHTPDLRLALRKLFIAFPLHKQTDEARKQQYQLYYDRLRELPADLVERTVLELIDTASFMPRIGTIRTLVKAHIKHRAATRPAEPLVAESDCVQPPVAREQSAAGHRPMSTRSRCGRRTRSVRSTIPIRRGRGSLAAQPGRVLALHWLRPRIPGRAGSNAQPGSHLGRARAGQALAPMPTQRRRSATPTRWRLRPPAQRATQQHRRGFQESALMQSTLISLKPRFADGILAGRKTVELRKRRARIEPGTRVIIYATSPRCAVLGDARVTFREQLPVEEIWNRYGARTAVVRREFSDYYGDADEGVAFGLEDARQYAHAVSLEMLRRENPKFRPPQSYMRTPDYVERLLADLTLVSCVPSEPRAYLGQTRGRAWIARLTRHGLGECVQPTEFPPRRTPWFLDNGAFRAYRHNRPWDEQRFVRALAEARLHESPPDFVVAPDIVAGGLMSLERSIAWAPRCASLAPVYLAVQDGMSEASLDRALDATDFAGVFLGGSMPWKRANGALWVARAHRRGLRCHVGRAGSARMVAWVRSINADSLDSCAPLWGKANLSRFLGALRQEVLPL